LHIRSFTGIRGDGIVVTPPAASRPYNDDPSREKIERQLPANFSHRPRPEKIVWKLHDEQLAAYIAYVLAVSQGEKPEIRKLFGARFIAFGDLSAELESKLTLKERRRAVRLSAYEAEIAALHDAAQRLQSRMEASYLQQTRFKNGILDESEEGHPKAPTARQPAPTA